MGVLLIILYWGAGEGVIGAGPSQQTPKYLQGFPLCGEHGAPIFKGEMYKRSFDHVILNGNISQNRIKLLNLCTNAFIMVILIKDLIYFWAINLPHSVLPPPPPRKIQQFHSPISQKIAPPPENDKMIFFIIFTGHF